MGTYLRGSSSLLNFISLAGVLPPLFTFFERVVSQSLHGFLLVFEGKERDLDPHFHQSLSPLCEGNPLDLDLGVLRVLFFVLPLIFLPLASTTVFSVLDGPTNVMQLLLRPAQDEKPIFCHDFLS